MTAFDSKSSKEANAKQHQRYPDLSAEMRRRANLRKTFAPGNGGFRYLKEHEPEKFKQTFSGRKRNAKGQFEPKITDSSESQNYDRSKEV